ncbi:glycosyltransferase [Dichotomopilus funicola]|uniref:UDP-N-acetylglucosamine transferase subunit ALG13 n=1 Tax=Dichotomopilus funicola TaxID=1934379 RepID=A0AAN6ZLK0_9PEZI|nr:glycosyltransferase [Dichotomopilus funicola]
MNPVDAAVDGSQASDPRGDRLGGGASPVPGRRCFVTIGATAGFRSLVEEVSTPAFLACLAAHEFTSLEVQCGPDLAFFEQRVASLSDEEMCGVLVHAFDYTGDMHAHILLCRGEAGARPAGCVISHGGTGTIGEVLGVAAPLIAVANPTLMDNHQLELVEDLEEQNLVVHGQIGSLPAAIHRIVQLIPQGTLDDLPPYQPPPFPVAAADRFTLFDWMVLTCYPEELAAQTRALDLGESAAESAAHQQQQQQQQHLVGTESARASSREDDALLQLD